MRVTAGVSRRRRLPDGQAAARGELLDLAQRVGAGLEERERLQVAPDAAHLPHAVRGAGVEAPERRPDGAPRRPPARPGTSSGGRSRPPSTGTRRRSRTQSTSFPPPCGARPRRARRTPAAATSRTGLAAGSRPSSPWAPQWRRRSGRQARRQPREAQVLHAWSTPSPVRLPVHGASFRAAQQPPNPYSSDFSQNSDSLAVKKWCTPSGLRTK